MLHAATQWRVEGSFEQRSPTDEHAPAAANSTKGERVAPRLPAGLAEHTCQWSGSSIEPDFATEERRVTRRSAPNRSIGRPIYRPAKTNEPLDHPYATPALGPFAPTAGLVRAALRRGWETRRGSPPRHHRHLQPPPPPPPPPAATTAIDRERENE
nr:unnamed protein product [Digitaria exilis]